MKEPTPEMIEAWKSTWEEYKDKLSPNKKSGTTEIRKYLVATYPLKEIYDDKAKKTVIDNVLLNKPFAEKLSNGKEPSAATFFVKNTGKGTSLYEKQDKQFKGQEIFVGIEIEIGYFCIEGSSLLWDELFIYRGLDEKDIQNYFL